MRSRAGAADPHYDDLWVGGKASYKLGGIIADAGELINSAPHLLPVRHPRRPIERYGYAGSNGCRSWSRGLTVGEQSCVAAHLVHVSSHRLRKVARLYRAFALPRIADRRSDLHRVNLGF
jgi:hypothetical protein